MHSFRVLDRDGTVRIILSFAAVAEEFLELDDLSIARPFRVFAFLFRAGSFAVGWKKNENFLCFLAT